MQIHYRGSFIVLPAGMALASGLTYSEQPTSVSIDFMGDAATVNTPGMKEA